MQRKGSIALTMLLLIAIGSQDAARGQAILYQESGWRASLEDALAMRRLRDFAYLLSRESLLANAITLADQREKLAVVRYYQGLTEIELGNDREAVAHLQEAQELAADGTALRTRAAALWESLDRSSVVEVRAQRRRAVPRPLDLQAVDTLALDDLADTSRDVIYHFYDPAIFHVALEDAMQRLETRDFAEPPAAEMIPAWSRLLRGDATFAEIQAVAAREKQAGENAWYLRAKGFGAQSPQELLEEAQLLIRDACSAAQAGPFEPYWMSFRTRGELQRRSDVLDVYWEVAWCYGRVHASESGMSIPRQADMAAIRGAALASHLSSPLLRTDWDLLRVIMLGELQAYNLDVKSWQLELTDPLLDETPVLRVLREMSRTVSGRIDLPDETAVVKAVDEEFAENVDILLTGHPHRGRVEVGEQAAMPSDLPTAEHRSAAFWWLIGVGLVVVGSCSILLFIRK